MVTLKPPCSSWSPTDMILLVFVLLGLPGETLTCPASCICRGLVVRCREAGLTELPIGLPSDMRLLDLSENSLSQFAPGSFGQLSELTGLILSDNKLTEIPVFDSRNSRLEKLILAGNQIRLLSGSAIAALNNLKRLDLTDNSISHLNGTSFPRNSSVDTLVLSENQISRIDGSWLTAFPQLKSLKLNKNSIGSLAKFPPLTHVHTLDLSNNQIGEVPSLVFEYLTSLKVIKLQKNGLRKLQDGGFFIAESKKAKKSNKSNLLEEIYLEDNALTEIGEGEFFGLQSLKIMYINNNKIARVHKKHPFNVCEALETLDLSHNLLPEVNSTWFSSLSSLKELRLDHNNITSVHPNSFIQCSLLTELTLSSNLLQWPRQGNDGLFRGLTSLNSLHLQDNRIVFVKGPGFEDLGSLEYLDVRQNQLSRLDENVFRGFRSLRRLLMNSSSLSCDCHLAWFPHWIREKNLTVTAAGFCKRGRWNVFHLSNDSFSCANHPWIAEHPSPVMANRGQNVTLRCRADSQSSSLIHYTWMKDGKVLISSDDILVSNNSGRATVTLLNVDFSHAGSYQCTANNGYHLVLSSVAQLEVYEFPHFTVRPQNAVVHVGSDVSIDCRATGYPEPVVVRLISATGRGYPAVAEGRLGYDPDGGVVIKNVSLVDAGQYYCNASNAIGSAITSFHITVRPPLPVIKRGPVDVTGVVGQSLVIQCNVTGLTLQGTVTWYKGTKKQQVQDIRRVRQTKLGEWLVFSTIKPRDIGQYRCRASTENSVVVTEYHLSIVQNDTPGPGSNESGSMGDNDVTWIIVSVVCGVVFACACWVIAFVICRVVRHPKRVTRKQRANGTSVAPSEAVKPRQYTNGHARPVIAKREMEEGSSGSGGMPIRIVSTPKAASLHQNGAVGGRPASFTATGNGSCRPVAGANGGCVVKQDQNDIGSNNNVAAGMNGTTQLQTSPRLQSASGAAPCIMVLSPDGSFQPLGTVSDSNRHKSVARAPVGSCDSDSDVD